MKALIFDLDGTLVYPVECQQRLGVTAPDCYVVGDAVWDLLAARRAGMLSIGLLSGGYGEDEPAILPMNLKMQLLIIKHLRILRFMGRMAASQQAAFDARDGCA